MSAKMSINGVDLKQVMEEETMGVKVVGGACALVWAVTLFVTGGFFVAALKNANSIDDGICDDDWFV